MSILIKRAKPPKNCWECLCNDLCVAIAKLGGACPFTEQIIGRDMFDTHSGIYPDCPLVEIPPHGRLIDADETKRVFGDYFEKVEVARRYAESLVDNVIPTVIESEEQEYER